LKISNKRDPSIITIIIKTIIKISDRIIRHFHCRVEGKIFYGHKIVLVTASPRFQSMLSSKLSEASSTPTVQINDIRYHIFQLVMQFLYCGGCSSLDVAHGDVLELMAAASFFQLEGLLRYTEARCSEMVDVDNVVAMYIHAKVGWQIKYSHFDKHP